MPGHWNVIDGDCVEQMAMMDEASVDAVVTDPPYGLSFMGKDWDSLGDYIPPPGAATEDRGSIGNIRGRGRGIDARHRARVLGTENRQAQEWHEAWAREALRVLKPGGHLLAFGGTRTSHRLACAIEDAGFEIRDTIAWMYGSGFPKSLDVSKAIDAAAGAEREVVGRSARHVSGKPEQRTEGLNGSGTFAESVGMGACVTAPATPEAEAWQGWGTALKPAHEPIVVARKPLAGTVAGNVLAHGTGALNVDATRIGASCNVCQGTGRQNSHPEPQGAHSSAVSGGDYGIPAGSAGPIESGTACSTCCGSGLATRPVMVRTGTTVAPSSTENPTTGATSNGEMTTLGRWPANVVLDPEAAAMLDEQTGERPSAGRYAGERESGAKTAIWGGAEKLRDNSYAGETGGASRFFYCAKSSSAERNAGLDEFEAVERTGQSAWAGCCNVCGCRMMLYGKPTCGHDDFRWVEGKPTKNSHPTVKPIALMRWLARLVTQPEGTVLDPFAGSGTTGCAAMLEGFRFVGIEREPEYAAIARARIAWWAEHPEGMELVARLEHEAERKRVAGSGQLGLFG